MVFHSLIPKISKANIESSFERITQPVTDFIRGNPIVAGIVLGAGGSLSTLAVASVIKRVVTRKKRKKTKKTTTRKRVGKRRKRSRERSKADIRQVRLRNLAKARRVRKRGGRRRMIRGPGLGKHEIRHSGKSTKGKFKVVQFRDKRTGKIVRFKAKK